MKTPPSATPRLSLHAFDFSFSNLHNPNSNHGAHVHHDQARRRSAQPGGRDHRSLREEGVQAPRPQDGPPREVSPGGSLRRPQQQGLLRWSDRLHGIWTGGVHGVVRRKRCARGAQDAGGDQAVRVRHGHHPRRLLRGGGTQRVPRIGLDRLCRARDQALVPGGCVRVGLLHRRMGVREVNK